MPMFEEDEDATVILTQDYKNKIIEEHLNVSEDDIEDTVTDD